HVHAQPQHLVRYLLYADGPPCVSRVRWDGGADLHLAPEPADGKDWNPTLHQSPGRRRSVLALRGFGMDFPLSGALFALASLRLTHIHSKISKDTSRFISPCSWPC